MEKWGDKFNEKNIKNLIANIWKEMQPDYKAKYNEINGKPNAYLIYLKSFYSLNLNN